MGRRAQLKPQSRIHRKSSSRNIPLFSYGKCFIQSGSVEKYSRRLNPYQRGFTSFAEPVVVHSPVPAGNALSAATPAIPFSTLRRSIDLSCLNNIASLFISGPFIADLFERFVLKANAISTGARGPVTRPY